MLPFVNRAVGISSFLGILYYTTFHNKTETPGLVKWFGGGQPMASPHIVIPGGESETQTEFLAVVEGGEGEGAPYELLMGMEVEEDKPFVAPLELIVLDDENLPNIYAGDWVIVGHLDYVYGSRRFMKRFMAFFERLSSRFNHDDLPLSFGILSLSERPGLGLRLGLTRIPSVLFLSAGRVHRQLTVETRMDWKALKNIIGRKGVWKLKGSAQETMRSRTQAVRDRLPIWHRLLEYKIGLRLMRFYSHDQNAIYDWINDSRWKQAVFGTGLIALSTLSSLLIK